jgi:hypothetical protein
MLALTVTVHKCLKLVIHARRELFEHRLRESRRQYHHNVSRLGEGGDVPVKECFLRVLLSELLHYLAETVVVVARQGFDENHCIFEIETLFRFALEKPPTMPKRNFGDSLMPDRLIPTANKCFKSTINIFCCINC